MKKIKFTKMAGAGNDFVLIDAKAGLNYKKLALKVCDRTNGIGADGLIVLDKSRKCDFRMRIINADSSEAEMCGNGVRCLAAYIIANKKTRKKQFTIQTLAGTIIGEAKGEVANVRLTNPEGYKSDIPLTINKKKINVGYIDTGVPHAIVYVDSLSKVDVSAIGRIIRNHKKFAPRGTNVNFVEQVKKSLVDARTYERGVEDETKACGTGSVAAGLVTYLKANPHVENKKGATMNVKTRGGEILRVKFDIKNDIITNVW